MIVDVWLYRVSSERCADRKLILNGLPRVARLFPDRQFLHVREEQIGRNCMGPAWQRAYEKILAKNQGARCDFCTVLPKMDEELAFLQRVYLRPSQVLTGSSWFDYRAIARGKYDFLYVAR